jgi:2-dehydro-3-deoxygluconokinase
MALFRGEGIGALSNERSFRAGMGGAESNVAIGLRRLGVPARWIGRVGDDPLGLLIARELRAEDVDATVITDPGAPTGLMIKENRAQGITNVLYYRSGSAGSRLRPADVPDEAVRAAALVHVTGITAALSDSALDTVRHAMAVARGAGVPVSFDLNYRRALWDADRARDVYREFIAASDIVFAGADEAAIAVGSPAPAGGDRGPAVPGERADPGELAGKLSALGPPEVVIKLGERGAVALADGRLYERDAVAVTPVDTVGAGDAFVAGYLSEVLAGHGPGDRLRTATVTGAFACLSPGDWEGQPRTDELHLLDAAERVIR